MSNPNLTETELAQIYLKHEKRPGGCSPFERNNEGEHVVPVGEVFCRVGDMNGDFCGNDNKYQSTNALRLHIKNEHNVAFTAGSKGPASQRNKALAKSAFAACQTSIFAYVEKQKEIREDSEFALTPRKGKSAGTKALKKILKGRVEKTMARNSSQPPIPKPAPSIMKKGVEIFNQSEMRRQFGMTTGKGCCNNCKKRKIKCPALTQALKWTDPRGCLVLRLFEKPDVDDEEPEDDA